MSTRLVMLGLLRERPLYGYELKHIIEDHMGDWTNIAFGSIYFALGKLAEEGFIEKVATEQEGRRPSRSVYQITASGREEFQRLLEEVWRDVEHLYYRIDIGLFFMEALPFEQITGHLRGRIAQLEAVLHHLNRHQAEQHEQVPRQAAFIFDHSRVHLQAELEWTRELLKDVEQEGGP